MLIERRTVRTIAREISDAAERAMDAYREGRVLQEPQITDRLLGDIEARLPNKNVNGITWRARTLRTGRGIAAEEKRNGADLLGVLDIAIPDFETKKGFIAQAKKAEPGQSFSKADWERLIEQCQAMLKRTPESYVVAYSLERGVRVFPATAVCGARTRDLFDLYNHSLSRFFESHIECFVGDSRLNSTNIETLDALADLPIENVLGLIARTAR